MFRILFCLSSGGQNCIIQHLVSSQSVGGHPMHSPLPTCAPDSHLQIVTIPEALYCNFDVLMMSTYCSKHVEAWNRLIVKQKFCASSLLITEINILRCTVSKTSKFLHLLWKGFSHNCVPAHSQSFKIFINQNSVFFFFFLFCFFWPLELSQLTFRNRSTGLFEMIVWVLTTCHTQYTRDSSTCIFLFNRTTLPVFVTYPTGALYVHPLWFYKHQHDNQVHYKLFVACQWWWFQWRFWFVPSVPGYLREEEKHKPDPWYNPLERNHME